MQSAIEMSTPHSSSFGKNNNENDSGHHQDVETNTDQFHDEDRDHHFHHRLEEVNLNDNDQTRHPRGNRRRNIFFALAILLALIVAGVYVAVPIYLKDDEQVIENYDSEQGIVENDFDNEKAQQVFNNAKPPNNGHSSHWYNNNHNNNINDNDNHGHLNDKAKNAAIEKWEHLHPDVPYPGSEKEGPSDIPSKDKNDAVPPEKNNGDNNDSEIDDNNDAGSAEIDNNVDNNDNDGDEDNDEGDDHDTENQPNDDNDNQDPLANTVCSHYLEDYKDWYEATVTKKDGTKYEVLQQYDHDSHAFTQGLTYNNGYLYESTGLYGESTVRILTEDGPTVIKSIPMADRYFGEGMAYVDGKLIQITWKKKKGFVYDAETLDVLQEFTYSTTTTQGWGITLDDCRDELIVTDGSEFLHFWDKDTLKESHKKVKVTRMNGYPARNLNEIEFWRGRVLANVWYEDVILVIDPSDGTVEKEYNFSNLWPESERKAAKADVLNGISVSSEPDVLWITGKKWNRMFRVKLLF